MTLTLVRPLSGALCALALLTSLPTPAQATYPKVCYGASAKAASAWGGPTSISAFIAVDHAYTQGAHVQSCKVVSPTSKGLYIMNANDANWDTLATLNYVVGNAGAKGFRDWCAANNGDIRMMFAGTTTQWSTATTQQGGWYGVVSRQSVSDPSTLAHEMGHSEYARHEDGYCSAEHADLMQQNYCHGGSVTRNWYSGYYFYYNFRIPMTPQRDAAGRILDYRFTVENRKP